MISVFDKKEDCCGCTACTNICPTNAITMKSDEEGFLYPVIDQKLCINCMLCKTVCPLQCDVKVYGRLPEPLVFAVKHKKEQVKMESTSGGAYTAISDYALKLSGVIYGAEFNDKFFVKHARATNASERDKFKGSKYVQTDLQETFKQIQEDLMNDKNVLFTGTGCQVAGLRNYLDNTKTNIDKLIINDIVCHGTASPLLWKEYLKFIQRKCEIKSYTFRYKGKGWRGYNIKVEFLDGRKKINTTDIKIYSNIFSSNLALRPSCYNCKYANLQRPSDIMIGDFWGIEKTMPNIDDNKGISLVIVNTSKGKDIFGKLRNDLDIWESNTKDCLQPNLEYPTRRPENRQLFWDDYYKFGFQYIARKYAGYSFKGRVKKFIVSSLKKFCILDKVKKLLR